jgi:chemotaxis protein CheD
MSTLVVGMADCRTSQDPEGVLITYALGSCVAVAIHDRVANVGGMLHFMLPESSLDPAKARERPYMFADTGIPMLFREAYRLGAEKRRLVVRLAGGAQVMDDGGVFNIGKRNYLAARKILWKAGVLVQSEEVGGHDSRTVRLEMSTGAFWMRGPGEGDRLVPAAAGKGR